MRKYGYSFYPTLDVWAKARNNAILNIKIKDDKVHDFFIDTIDPINKSREIEELKDNLCALQKDVYHVMIDLAKERKKEKNDVAN